MMKDKSDKRPRRELPLAGVMLVAALLLAGCDDTAPVDIAPGDGPTVEAVLGEVDGGVIGSVGTTSVV